MIYTVICDSKKRDFSKIKKEDCRIIRQSIPELSSEIKEYIDKAKNQDARLERQIAYSALYIALKAFFGVENPVIEREKDGKPRLVSHKIFFNISHSDGLVAVSLSDTHDVGVDLQSEISAEREKRLEKRFLKDFSPLPCSLDISFYFLENDELFNIDLSKIDLLTFTDKWSAFESVLKLGGHGFGVAREANILLEKSMTDIRKIELDNTSFSLANSIKNG